MPSKITFTHESPTMNAREHELVENAVLMRREFLQKLVDPNRDIDKECGYPPSLEDADYKGFTDRHGIASRVVSVFPEESWKRRPDIYESEDGKKTAFEIALEKLETDHSLNHYMERIDILSGRGHYGVLLIGIDDGLDLENPAAGIDERGARTPRLNKNRANAKARKITFLRPFDEWLAPIDSYEEDITNPRFGLPKFYMLKFADPRQNAHSIAGATLTVEKRVHWSRVIHVCDNRTTSEIIGEPRLQNVFNYLYDLKKILSGSGEMFWKGGFPGYAFEVAPENIGQVDFDKDSMRKEMEAFSNSLQRYMALVGVSAKSLAPQVADPRGHFDIQMDAICIAKAIPKRIFMGSEQAQLASTQDKKTWNERLKHRQDFYVTPMLVRPVIDRLIALGILPEIETYFVEWPEVFGPSDDEQATTAFKKTQSLATYIGSGSEHLVPPMDFLTKIMSFSTEEAQSIIDASQEHDAEFDDLMDKGNPNEEKPPNDAARGKKTKDHPKG